MALSDIRKIGSVHDSLTSSEPVPPCIACRCSYNQFPCMDVQSAHKPFIVALDNPFSEYLLREALEEIGGVSIGGTLVNNIRYTNDTVLIADSEHDLQQMLSLLCDTCQEFGMQLNAKKTKTMCVSRIESETIQLRAEEKALEQRSFLHNAILEGAIEGTRAKGRPRRMWLDDITGWSRTSSYVQAKRLAENKVAWGRLMANLRNEDGSD
ncbi:hypothetical protein CAPTEDRAFT_217768 [Capitella teleta]|uniref:Reverse transcriptase domain-containing protein n=1 Tax=Capitella teleta TaxID=283909 RepID=R7U9E7_CAPTE|nr:hypothetical protein CAPTEDRAFT_217768 [Capitella teleta]|eukprot:ELU02614.1 hypothetical protein CAPTEDRAFT_217768 [Capitella teleta]